uniref:Inositol oxygenase n=1 Tax=Cucumis melo TaxID=3656 RepID=A0A9I9D4A8_CUCME
MCLQVKNIRKEYGQLNRVEMSIWECCELLNDVVDESDPDLDEPQIQHLLQTAEAIRKDYPNEDWLHLTALIHGSKIRLKEMNLAPFHKTSERYFSYQALVVFLNGRLWYFVENPDYYNPAYNTKYGVYSPNCGLDNVMMSWGHDDYISDAYKHLMNEEDVENLKWLRIFNKYDLYSKSKVRVNVEKVKPYYLSLIEKCISFTQQVLSCQATMVKQNL